MVMTRCIIAENQKKDEEEEEGINAFTLCLFRMFAGIFYADFSFKMLCTLFLEKMVKNIFFLQKSNNINFFPQSYSKIKWGNVFFSNFI
jgi:hypothetical protein